MKEVCRNNYAYNLKATINIIYSVQKKHLHP